MLKDQKQVRLATLVMLLAQAISLHGRPLEVKAGADAANPPSRILLFEQAILPILERSCVKCHSGSNPQGGLDVRTRVSLLRGGAKGPALVPGSPEKSILFRRVHSGEMPLGGPSLSAFDLELIRQWIQQGAPATNPAAMSSGPPGSDPRDRAHWAFQ